MARYFKRLWMSYDNTRCMSWLGARTSRFNFGSNPIQIGHSTGHQWDPKRKLFSLVEVHALTSAILVNYSFIQFLLSAKLTRNNDLWNEFWPCL